jgi:hypothetical protein
VIHRNHLSLSPQILHVQTRQNKHLDLMAAPSEERSVYVGKV